MFLTVAALSAAMVGVQAQEKTTSPQADAGGFVPLFTQDGFPKGWLVRAWNDVNDPPAKPTEWKVERGVLHGGEPRGSWLMGEKEDGDVILEFEFKRGERGNSGCALHAPLRGDPAFDGLELQMADLRYNPEAKDSELTGGLYRAVAPKKQVYKPTEWNKYQVTLKGPRLKVVLNGELIQDLDVTEQSQEVKRHDGTLAPPIKDRPRKGHIGFQELSRGEEHAQIRNARIKVLD
jgi:3-keto-disaccharide hydrolase